MTIVGQQLVKRYGPVTAVDGLQIEVGSGRVFGLIGPNGAGKTTTLRMLAGLMRPSAGQALICGVDVQREPRRAKAMLGFVSGSTGLYERLTVRELLGYYGRLYGMRREQLDERIVLLSHQLSMSHLLDRRCGKLSTGEAQRASLARASIQDPPVLILDEPTAGLDVVASQQVGRFIAQARDRQRAVLFSTHYMTEAELLCDELGLLHRGRLLGTGSAAQLKQRYEATTLEELFVRLDREGVPPTEKAPPADGTDDSREPSQERSG